MQGIKEWIKRMSEDKEFSKKYQNINDNKEIARLAREDGFDITEEEIMDLKMQVAAGGDGVLSDMWKSAKEIGKDVLNQTVQNTKDRIKGNPGQAGWYWNDGQGNMTYYGDGNNYGGGYGNGGNYGGGYGNGGNYGGGYGNGGNYGGYGGYY